MTGSYRAAVLSGSKAAARLHKQLGLRDQYDGKKTAIDIFAVISQLDVPVLVRPLDTLLGAYLNEPQPGILVTSKRDRKIQRLTAAHELGHYILKHTPSLDDEGMLRRAVVRTPNRAQYMEFEADAFAFAFMMPKWLIASVCKQHKWTKEDLLSPANTYQLSLRIGVSYEAICRTMNRYGILSKEEMDGLLGETRKSIKQEILNGVALDSYRGDVWKITNRDSGLTIKGSTSDTIVFDLAEHSGSGYRWHIDSLGEHGFKVISDRRHSCEQDQIGSPINRHIVAQKKHADSGSVEVIEARPWKRDQRASDITVNYDWNDPEEEGLPRTEKLRLLEQA